MRSQTIAEVAETHPFTLKIVLKVTTIAAMAVGLVVLPAPLLPSKRMTDATQSALELSWEAAYFASAILLQAAFYFTFGLMTTLVINRAATLRGRLLQIALLPLGLVGFGLTLRTVRAGHLPIFTNIAVPIVACLIGVTVGFVLLYQSWKASAAITAIGIAAALWGLIGGTSNQLQTATRERLQRIVAAGPQMPAGDARFGRILQIAFSPSTTSVSISSAVEQNRAAILAVGIAAGHQRIADLVGLDDPVLIQEAAAVAQGATLDDREDWPRHFALSAALAVLEQSFVSDAGGLMKEQMDALGRGSGFSFGDLAADRAGVRFAEAATHSEKSARATQARLQKGYSSAEFFPVSVHFPENLTVEEFRRNYDAVGSQKFRAQEQEIEQELDSCAALVAP